MIGLVSLVTVALMMATVVLWQLRAHDHVNIATRDVSAITKIQNFFTTIPGYVVRVYTLSCVCGGGGGGVFCIRNAIMFSLSYHLGDWNMWSYRNCDSRGDIVLCVLLLYKNLS